MKDEVYIDEPFCFVARLPTKLIRMKMNNQGINSDLIYLSKFHIP